MTEFSVSLQDRVAIIVGAAGGMGRAIAARLAAAGAVLALIDLDLETVQTVAADCGGLALAADITDRGQVELAMRQVETRYGGADVLVNAAGTNTRARTLDTMAAEEWERVLAVNLNGVFHCIQAVLPLLRARGGGVIVTVSSTAAVLTSSGAGTHYCAAKRALLSLNESINLEQGRHGIRACVICPGEADTPLVDMRPEPPSAARRAAMLQPGDIAEVVHFVATRPPRVTISDIILWPSAQLSGTYTV
jgi:NAD(P)-dependent dehydrogenase (short-subunit alcohol dehydrogenase family)